MTLRRDFLAFTAGAVAARTVLPIAAWAAPPERDVRAELLALMRELGEAEQVAMLNGLQRHHAGIPFEEAMRGVYVELGRPVPAGVLS